MPAEQEPNPDEEREATVHPSEMSSDSYLVTRQLQRMPHLCARGLIYVVVVLVASAGIYAYLARIDIVSSGSAVARPSAHKLRILSDRRGYVEEVFAGEGKTVAPGDPLFRIRSEADVNYQSKARELKATIPLKGKHFRQQKLVARQRIEELVDTTVHALKVLELRNEKNRLTLDRVDTDIRYWSQQVKTLTEVLERATVMYEKRITTLEDFNASKGRLEHARAQLEKTKNDRETALKEGQIIQEEIDKEKARAKSRETVLKGELRSLEIEEENVLAQMRYELELCESMLAVRPPAADSAPPDAGAGNVIRAELAGTISEMYVRTSGAYVREGDPLCTVVPEGSPLYMDIVVHNRDVGFIAEGLEVKYKFDAFPYRDHGLLRGLVESISPSAVEDPRGGFVYHVRGTLAEPFFVIKGKKYPLKPGMTATAELVTQKKSILEILVSRVKE